MSPRPSRSRRLPTPHVPSWRAPARWGLAWARPQAVLRPHLLIPQPAAEKGGFSARREWLERAEHGPGGLPVADGDPHAAVGVVTDLEPGVLEELPPGPAVGGQIDEVGVAVGTVYAHRVQPHPQITPLGGNHSDPLLHVVFHIERGGYRDQAGDADTERQLLRPQASGQIGCTEAV